MRILVTGAGGFVGRRLLPRLGAAGWQARGFDREVDVTRADVVAEVVADCAPDAVVHLAALSFVPDSQRDPGASFRVNYLGTRHLLEAVRLHAPLARVLLVSTGHVYGAAAAGDRFDESAPLRPDSPYARTKAAADLLARHYAERGLDVVRARPFNHTGAGRPEVVRRVELRAPDRRDRSRAPRAAARASEISTPCATSSTSRTCVDAYLRLLDPQRAGGRSTTWRAASAADRARCSTRSSSSPASARAEARSRSASRRSAGGRRTARSATRRSCATRPAGRRASPFDDTLRALLEDWRAGSARA